MKRIFTLMTLLMLGVVYVQATDYGLRIGGNYITSTGDIDVGQSMGTINWDGGILTFNNVDITYNGSSYSFIYYSGTSNLTIKFIGNNRIMANRIVIRSSSSKKVFLEGEINKTGTLTMGLTESADPQYDVIWVNGDLFISWLYLNVNGKDYAISGLNSNEIFFNEVVLDARAPTGTAGAICNFASASFNHYDAYLTTGVFNPSKMAVCDDAGNPLQRVTTDATLFVDNVIVGIGYEQELDVYPKGLRSGSIRFSYNNKTLTLDGIDIKTSDRFIYLKKRNDLKIVVKGTNSVDAHGTWGIFSNKDFTIEGATSDYEQNVLSFRNSFGSVCLWLGDDEDGTMTLKNLTLDVKGTAVGIYSTKSGDLSSSLVIENCKIKSEVTGSGEYSSIHGFNTCTLKNCGVNTAETPVYYNTAKNSYTSIDGTQAKTVSIDVPSTIYDGITVLGTPVTNLNVNNILVDGLMTGNISYDYPNKTLTLNDVKLTTPEGNTECFLKVLTNAVSNIDVVSNANIIVEGDVIYTRGDGEITLTGNGKFSATSTKNVGLSLDGESRFVFDFDGSLELFGYDRGIWGDGFVYEKSIVTMKSEPHSDYYFKGECMGAIVNVADLKMEGMDFFYNSYYGVPGCFFYDRYVYQNGGDVVKGDNTVNIYRITKTYDITVAGTPVNNCNNWAIGSRYITKGGPTAVYYNPNSTTLTLDNVTIDYDEENNNFEALKNSGVDGLNIELVGKNVINTTGFIALEAGEGTAEKNTITMITGDGKLDAKSGWYAFRLNPFSTLDIGGNVEVKAEGTSSGIANNMVGKQGETLIIRDKARVMAKGIIQSSVQRLNDIQLLDGVKILKPDGAEIKMSSDFGYGVYVGDELTKEWVVFGVRIKGDVNGDGSVDVADIGKVIDVMAAGSMADLQLFSSTDVNGDGSVDVADIGVIIDVMAASSRSQEEIKE